MRDFFIQGFETLISIILVIAGIGVVIGAVGAMINQGILAGLGVLILGAIYLLMTGGIAYLALGIYHNTKRTAELLEAGARTPPTARDTVA